MSSSKPKRDFSSVHDIADSSRYLRRLSESLAKKMRRFPDGQCAIVIGATTREGRVDAIKKTWKVIGDGPLRDALEHSLPHIESSIGRKHAIDKTEFLTMPGNAEKRAKKVRSIIQTAWKVHVTGTAHEGTKHLYAIVKKYPEMIFPWWKHITNDAPFTNTAVDDPDISERVFRYLAPRMYGTRTISLVV